MADGSETVWRNALIAKGKDWVAAELRRRPGRPGDAVYDIVFEEPLPTREFCQRWCAEEENRLVRYSWEKVAALIFLILTIVCAVGAVKSWNETPPQQGRSAAATKSAPQPAPTRGSGQITNDVPGRHLRAQPGLRRLATACLLFVLTRPMRPPSARRRSEEPADRLKGGRPGALCRRILAKLNLVIPKTAATSKSRRGPADGHQGPFFRQYGAVLAI